jgi:gliding motility-associated-like protein
MLRKLFILLFFLIAVTEAYAQPCDATVPSYIANLAGNPDSVWLSPYDVRKGGCCGVNTGPPDNDRCVEFWLTLDPEAEAIRFDIAKGAVPPGALYWKLNCGPSYPVGQDICIQGTGPHRITFCKPGNNPNAYTITSIPKPKVSPPTTVSDGCTGYLAVYSLDPATIKWSSDPVNATYDSYLSCTAGCTTTTAKYQPGAPPYVDYVVTGVPTNGCSLFPVSLKTRVYFVNDKKVVINPEEPTICYGGTSTTLTANATGGAPPYKYIWSTGATTQSIDVGTTGSYWVHVSDTSSCPQTADTTIVTAYLSPIIANAGPDQISCANNAMVTLQGSVQQAKGGKWTGGTGTYAPSDTILNAVYTPSAAEITAGKVKLALTTTGNRSCPAHTDSVIITIKPSPVVNAGPDLTVCANNNKVNLTGTLQNAGGVIWSGGSGGFSPSATTLTTVYSPVSAENTTGKVRLYLTSTNNGTCLPVKDSVDVTITPAPTVNAGPDLSSCQNKASVNLSGSVTIATGGSWSNGSGSYTSGSNSLSGSYNPSATEITSGKATLYLTTTGNGLCSPVTDTLIINIAQSPVASAGNDQAVCANNSAVTLAGSVTRATGGTWSGGTGTFNPGNTTLNASYTPSGTEVTAGFALLTLTTTGNGLCNAEADQVRINITPAPVVNAGNDFTVCSATPAVTLNGSVTIATGGTWSGGTGTFSPGTSALNASYTPSAAEITAKLATLTLTSTGNGNCQPVTDQVSIVINPTPIADAGTDIKICTNNPTTVLSPSVTGAISTNWTGGGGTFTPGRSAAAANYTLTPAEITANGTTLTLNATSDKGCPASDNISLTVTPSPVVNAGPDQSVCANNASVKLNGSVTVATGGTWSGGTGTFSPSNTTLNATYTPSASEITAGKVTLILSSTGNGNCNPVNDDVIINITPAPTVNAGPDNDVCANNSTININGTITIASGGIWSGGSGTFAPSATSPVTSYIPSQAEITGGQVTLTLTSTGNGNCLAVSDDVIYKITPSPVVNAGPDAESCANNPKVTLAGTITVATGGTWSGGAGSFNPSATSLNTVYTPTAAEITAGNVSLTLTSTGNGKCKAVSDPVKITILPKPVVNAGPDMMLCEINPTANLSGSVTGATGGLWSSLGTGGFTPAATNLITNYNPSAGDLTAKKASLILTSTGNSVCLAVKDTIQITYSANPIVNAGPDKTVCSNVFPLQLEGSGMLAKWSGGAGTYTPNDSTLNAKYFPTQSELKNGVVNLRLATKSNGSCPPVQDDVKISLVTGPSANAGPDQTICSNRPAVTLNGQVQNAGGGIWSGGAGTFSPSAASLQTVYQPTAAEISNGSVKLILTTTNNGLCTPSYDTVLVTIKPGPVVEAGQDLSVCANKATVNLNGSVQVATGGVWSTSGKGSFANASSLLTSYIPSKEDTAARSVRLFLETTGNGLCYPSRDSLLVTITPAPISNAGLNQDFCSNNPTVSLTGSVIRATGGVWSGGNGGYVPANTLNTTYIPSPDEITAGYVILTLTTTGNGNCNAVSDTAKITVLPSPLVSAGPDQLLCEINPNASLSGTVVNAGGGIWKTLGSGTLIATNSLSTTYQSSTGDLTAGTVKLVLTSDLNGKCLPVSDTLILTYSKNPVINAGPDKTVCSNSFPIQLEGSGMPGKWTGGAGTYIPNDSTLNAKYIPTANELKNGSVNLRISTKSNGSCPAVSDDVKITLLPGPLVSAGPDLEVCSNRPEAALSGTFQNAAGIIWSGGAGTYGSGNTAAVTSYTPSAGEITAGFVKLVITSTGNGLCAAARDTMRLTIKPGPAVEAGPDVTVCANNATVNLSGSVQIATGGSWSTTGTGYFVNGNSLTAEYIPSAKDTAAKSVKLYLTTTGNGTCFPSKDSLKITINPAPLVNAGPDQNICRNNTLVTLAGSVTKASGGNWTGGAGIFTPGAGSLSATYQPTTSEILNDSLVLTLTTTGEGSCLAVTDKMVIHFTPEPVVNSGSDNVLCINDPKVTLNGSVKVSTGGTWKTTGTGTFSPDENTPDATYNATPADLSAGTVKLILTSTGNNNCLAVTDTLNVAFAAATSVNAGPDKTVCTDGLPVQLEAYGSKGTWSNGGGSYSPTDSTLNAIYTPTAAEITAGKAVLILTSKDNGVCPPMKDTVTILIPPGPVVTAGTDHVVCADSSYINLSGNVQFAGGGIWTTSGNGNFSADTLMNPRYNFTSEDKAAGQISFKLTSTKNGTCKEVSSSILLRFTPVPTAEAGPPQTVCGNNSLVSLDGNVTVASGGKWSAGNGAFIAADNILKNSYKPSADEINAGEAKIYLTTTGNGDCRPVTDSVIIIITPSPASDAGDPQSVCSINGYAELDGKISIAEGGEWSSTGTGIFAPGKSFLNATYTPSQADKDAGTVKLILTTTGNGNCLPVSDTVDISVTPVASADPGKDTSLCSDHSLSVILAGKVTGSPGGTWSATGTGTFADSAALNTIYTFSNGDYGLDKLTFTLITSGNGGCNDTASFVVSVVSAPYADAGQDFVICNDDDQGVLLTGSVSNAEKGIWKTLGSGNFVPADTLPVTRYLLSDADKILSEINIVYTTAGHPFCASATDTAVILLNPHPVVDAGTDTVICADKPSVFLDGSVTNATGGIWKYSGNGAIFSATDLDPRYDFDSLDYVSGFVNFILTTTGNGDCKAYSDTTTVRFTPRVSVNAGSDVTVCANNSEVKLAGSFTTANGVKWTGGTGTFPENSEEGVTSYLPSQNEINKGGLTLYLTTTGNGDCNAVTDSTVITITPAPTADAGPDQVLCSEGGIATLSGLVSVADGGTWTSSGTGTFAPVSNIINVLYYPSDTDKVNQKVTITLTSTGNGNCLPVQDSLEISITKVAVADAGKDTVLCSDEAVAVKLGGKITGAPGGYWTTDGKGKFDDSLKTDAVYTLDPTDINSGKVTLTLTTLGNNNCNDTSTVIITILPAPEVNAGPDITVCNDNDSGLRFEGTVNNALGGTWTTTGTGTLIPDDSLTNVVYHLSDADRDSSTIPMILTTIGHPYCKSAMDTALIFLTPRPEVSAGKDSVLCSDNMLFNLTASVQTATGGIWTHSGQGSLSSDTALNAVYTFADTDYETGNVRFILTTTGNGDCKAYSDTINLNLTPVPTVDAGTDQTVCANNPAVKLSGSVTIASGGRWSGGNGSFTEGDSTLSTGYIPSSGEIQNGKVTLTLTTTGNGDCRPVKDTMTINITPAPVADAGPDQVICSSGGTATLQGNVTIATGGIWTSTGSGSFSPANNLLNTVYYPSVADKDTGSFYIVLTSDGNGNCLPVRDTLKVDVTTVAVADPGKDSTLCSDKAVQLDLNGKINGAPGAVWTSSGSGIFTDSTDLNTVYNFSQHDVSEGTVTLTLTTTGNNNCNDTASFTVTVIPAPIADAGSDVVICNDNDSGIELNGSVKNATGGIWHSMLSGNITPADTSLSITYSVNDEDRDTTQISLVLTTTGHPYCSAAKDTINISLTPRPEVNAGPDTTICKDNAVFGLSGQVKVATGAVWSYTGSGTISDSTDLNARYTFSDADLLLDYTDFVLTTTGNGDCKAYNDSLRIYFTPAVKVDAGEDVTVCGNNADVKLSGTMAVARGVIWTGGTGTFNSDSLDMNAIYSPSAEEISAGGVVLHLTSTGNGRCKAVTDSIRINITPAPEVNADDEINLCTTEKSAIIKAQFTVAGGISWSTMGTGSFLPDTTSQEVEYFYSASDSAAGKVFINVTTTQNDKCLAVKDSVILNIFPAPSADAGASPVCADSARMDLNGSVSNTAFHFWKASGTGIFKVDSTDLKGIYEPSAEDISDKIVFLVLTGKGTGVCQDVTDTVEVHIVPLPAVNAGSDYEVCENNISVNLSGSYSNADGIKWQSSGGGAITPDDGSTEIRYAPTTADMERREMIFTLTTINDPACQPETDTVVVKITDKPFVSAGEDYTVCADTAYIDLTGDISIQAGVWKVNGTGNFSDSTSLNTRYTFSQQDFQKDTLVFSLTSDDLNGCISITDNKYVIINPAPTIDAGENISICAIADEIYLNGNVTVSTGGEWSSDGTGNLDPTSGNGYRYSISAEDKLKGNVRFLFKSTGNGLCRQIFDSLNLNISQIPLVDAGEDLKTCIDAVSLNLTGSTEFADSFEWYSFGSGNFSQDPKSNLSLFYSLSGNDRNSGGFWISLTAFDSLCFPVTDSLQVSLDGLPAIDAGADLTVCRNDSVNAFAPEGFVKYLWLSDQGDTISESTGAKIFVPSSTIGIVEVTDNNGCRNRDTINFTPVDPPKVTLADHFCLEGTYHMAAEVRDVPAVNGVFRWLKDGTTYADGTTEIDISQTGTYVLTYTFDKCISEDSMIVTGKPSINPAEKYVCQDAATTASTNAVEKGTYTWFSGSIQFTSDSSICAIDGKFTSKDLDLVVTVKDTNGCYDTTLVKVYSVPPPDINLLDIPPCRGELAVLNAEPKNIKDREHSKYEWFKDNKKLPTGSSMIRVDTGYYKVIYTLGECTTTDSASVDYKPVAVSFMEHKNKFCKELEGSVVIDAGPATAYKWLTTGDSSRTTVVVDSGYHAVKIYNEFNCYVLDSVYVRLVCPPRMYVPTAIKAGQSGINGRTIVQGMYFTRFSMTVFNRWGEIIFHTENPDETWDGTYRGELMPEGVYPYIINYDADNDEYKGPYKKDGSITLVR